MHTSYLSSLQPVHSLSHWLKVMILLYEKYIIHNRIYFWIVYSLLLVFVAFHAPVSMAFVVEAMCSHMILGNFFSVLLFQKILLRLSVLPRKFVIKLLRFWNKSNSLSKSIIVSLHFKVWIYFQQEPDARKDWRQKEKGAAEDEMAREHQWLKGHESAQTPRDCEGQGSLGCCSPWVCKESGET